MGRHCFATTYMGFRMGKLKASQGPKVIAELSSFYFRGDLQHVSFLGFGYQQKTGFDLLLIMGGRNHLINHRLSRTASCWYAVSAAQSVGPTGNGEDGTVPFKG